MIKIIFKILSCYFSNTNDQQYISSTLSHACSTPLTILQCNLEHLLSDIHPNKSVVKESLLATKRLSVLLQPSYTHHKRRFNVKHSLDTAVALLKMKYPVNILHSYENLDIEIEANQYEIEEMLMCILNNAVESYPTKSTSNVVIVYGRKHKNNVLLWIHDFGRGMNKITKILAFIKNFTTKKAGSGLGLPFVQDIVVKKYHGKLKCESKEDLGTTVSISLPLSKIKRNHILG